MQSKEIDVVTEINQHGSVTCSTLPNTPETVNNEIIYTRNINTISIPTTETQKDMGAK